MQRFQKIIAVYIYGLGCGLYNIHEVVKLCDKLIEVKDSVPYEIIETSLMVKSKIDDAENKLLQIIETMDYEEIAKYILGLLHKKLFLNEFSEEHVIKSVARILLHTGVCYETKYYSLYSLDDSYDLCQEGIYSNLSEVIEQLKSELQEYEKYAEEFNELLLEELSTSKII